MSPESKLPRFLMRASVAVLASSVLLLVGLTGCSLGTVALSGPDTTPATVAINMNGTVRGGQQPVTASTIQLYVAGAAGYGSAASPLISTLSGPYYYPGGAKGCLTSADSIVSYSIASDVVTFTASNTLMANQSVTISGLTTGTYLNGQTLTVLSASASQFTAAFTHANVSTTVDSGSATPSCNTTVQTDINGNFTITGDYTCPSPTSLVYITSSGGNPGLAAGTNNSAIKLAAPLGQCGNLSSSTTVIINEATTVATAFALGQYFTPTFGSSSTDSFGAPNTIQAQQGITNAFATVNNLVDTATGNAVQTANLTSAAGTITTTPEYAKLYTIADILASCVNSLGTIDPNNNCNTLFTDVTPSYAPGTTSTTATVATDTLQAAIYMSLNPTSTNSTASAINLSALYALASSSASPPFTGVTSAPTDWTIGITYGSNTTVAGSGMYLMNYPSYLAVDASGDVWVVNDAGASATSGNSLTELSPVGAPMAQPLTGATLLGPAGVSIDPAGNVWIPNYGSSSELQTSVVEYTTGDVTNTFNTNEGPQRLAIDGKGDAFVLEPQYKGLGDLEEIPAGSTNGATATTLATGLSSDFSNLAIDSNYTIWVTGGGSGSDTGSSGSASVFQFLYSSGSPHYPTTPSATTDAGGTVAPEQAIAIDNANDVWISNYNYVAYSSATSTPATPVVVSEIAANDSSATIAGAAGSPFTPFPDPSSSTNPALTKPEFQVMDGAGNIWIANAVAAGPVFEISSTGAALSPQGGFVHTYDEPYGIAVDPSGNVWVANYDASSSATKVAYITEIVGAAAPVVTPLAAGLPTTPGGVSKLATKP